MQKPTFSIKDRVYHVTPESPRGIVIDVRYSYAADLHEYQVAFSAEGASLWYYDHELSNTKQYD